MKEQTNAWLEWRSKGIGSSDAPIIMEVSPWSTPQKLWELKTGKAKAGERTYAMQRGLVLEASARQWYEEQTGIAMEKALATHKSLPFIRASLDGVNHEVQKALEIKCPGREDHKKALDGKVPKKYLWQLVHILLVTGLPVIDYVSYDGRNGIIIPFERDEKLEAELLTEEKRFWAYVVTDTRPPEKENKNYPFKVRKTR